MAGSPEEKALIRRYLIWCFKTTKESLDRIDRKFTQVKVDRYLLRRLDRQGCSDKECRKFIEDFKTYVDAKQKEGLNQKFLAGQKALTPDYLYLQTRLGAIKDAIAHFLGPEELVRIELLYEEEMTRRILESKEH